MTIKIKTSDTDYPREHAKRELTSILLMCDGDDFVFESYFFDSNADFRQKINEKSRELDRESFTYRILNHWEKEGLLIGERGLDGKGWRRFSFIDRIWMEIILSLRKIGVSLENIRKVRTALTYDFLKGSEFPYLEYNCARFLREQSPTYLLVFSDFHAEVARQMVIEKAHLFGALTEDHIRINLGEMISRIYTSKELKSKYTVNPKLNVNEFGLLNDIRSGNFKGISVELREGEITRLKKEVLDPDIEFHQAVKGLNYGEVTVMVEKGRIVGIRKTIKEKTKL